ncbi:hypothetical protein [Terrabacter sp. Root181]|uniref:hypothetical protein n=1 Tax=Terrabacter sp. Root181 TaxID=1736484 RepID=UPI0006FBBC55|nr:hypothetical protein [Terrabacter sp. Root181]KRB47091.1 hypothetical protein ASD90_01530 [Terrabacter sp. Root181]
MTRPRQRWELEDPELVLRSIDDVCPLVSGSVVMAALTLDSQELTAAAYVPDPAESQPFWDPHDASSRLSEVALQLVPESTGAGARPGRSPVTHLLVTVVCREGRVIDTIAEHRWFGAWRYSDHLTSAVDGDVYVVTPHGWTGVMDHRAGHQPRLRPRLTVAPDP